ncbi:MAG TPA: hypothetical protein VKQ52_13450, partial [Puia sp.]|nr:hypothetical protein [Puia sp.]
ILMLTALLAFAGGITAQSILDRPVTLRFKQEPLGRVLETAGNALGITFSYNSAILNKDSLVTLTMESTPLRVVLDTLFKGRIEPHEDGRYIILLPAHKTDPPPTEPKHYTINGIILDETTGKEVRDASIYDADQLIATLSKADGSFVVKLKGRRQPGSLTVSKEFYTDTTIRLPPATEGRLTILLTPVFSPKPSTLSSPQPLSPDSISISWQADSAQIRAIMNKDLVQVEMTGFGKFLLSSRLKIQTLNLKKLFIQRPVQVCLVPLLSTNGALNSQVTNKFSVNCVGGYSAGLEGTELGGVFNIDKRKMHGVQAAGVVNIAGDSVAGVQMAGVYNQALDTMKGMQAAGAVNNARFVKGVQLSGAVNVASRVEGAQLSGGVNITRHLRGFQLGIVNIADTSEGVGIGLLNIVKHGGIHELSLYTDEFSPLNIAFRSGNKALYTIFLAGLNPGNDRRSYYTGFGLGHRFPLSPALALDVEASSAHVAPVAWKNYGDNTWLHRLNVDLHWQTGKWFALSAGPSMAIYTPQRDYTIQGHLYHPVGYSTFTFSGRNIGWIGWHAALNFL